MHLSTRTRSLAVAFTAAVAAVSLSAAPASAAAPKFKSASAAISGDNLVVSFREVGLGNTDVDYLAAATATSEYGCVNKGGNRPQAANKTSITETRTSTATFSPKNGTVNGSITLTPPGPGDFTCPSGQRLAFFGVTYTDVSITDTTNDVTADIPGTIRS